MTFRLGLAGIALAGLVTVTQAAAQQPVALTLSFKNQRFHPATLTAPANVPITLHLKNLDAAPMEFESVSLRVEKVVTGNGKGVIRLRRLAPGRYTFFDDFHPKANGVLLVR